MSIKPTVGRIVWYRHTDGAIRAAIVVGVNGDFNLNLFVFGYSSSDMVGGMMDSVTHADPEIEPGCMPSWHWMPYQVEQAKKAEAKLEAMSSGRCSTGSLLGGAAGFSQQHARFDALSMALRTPGLSGHHEVLAAAKAYQAHIEGEAAELAKQPAPGAAHTGYSEMQPHQQRVVDEKCELAARLAKLTPFFDTPIFAGLPEEEKQRLERQEEAMRAYGDILTERIAAFAPATTA